MNTRHFLTTAAAALVGALIAGVILYVIVRTLDSKRVPHVKHPVTQPEEPKPKVKPKAKPAPAPVEETPDTEEEADE